MSPRAYLLPGVLSFACPPLQAALEFEAGRPVSTPACGSDCLVPTDLDGDGDLDLVARVENHSSVIWYENTGNPQAV